MTGWARLGRTLRGRWMLALLGVFVVVVALVAVAIRISTAQAFEDYVVTQALDGLTQHVEEHVREAGSLEGFRPGGRQSAGTVSPRQGVGRGPRGAPVGGGPGQPPRRAQPEGEGLAAPSRAGAARFPSQLGAGENRSPIRFGLADLDGRLVLPFEGSPVGSVLPQAVLATGHPVEVDGQLVGWALVPADPFGDADPFPDGSPESAFLRTTRLATVAALVGGMLVALALVWGLTGRIVRPLRRLTAAAQSIAEGDVEQAVEVETDDEVGHLATAFNAMSRKLATANALRRQMTADVAHDLRTPLTTVLATLEAMRDGALPATPARLAAAHAEADRLGRLVGDLHTLALADAHEVPVSLGQVRPADILRRLALTHEVTATRMGLTLVVRDTSSPAVRADPDRLVQALGNLLQNAIRHTPEGGRITLESVSRGGGVAFVVTDTGIGIPPDLLARAFERSVRGDVARSGEGSGLGLAIVRALAEVMGGRAGISSPPGNGVTAWVWLPNAERRL